MELKLLNSTQEILNLVTDLTGKSFKFIHKSDLPTLAMVKIARENMPLHLIYYKNISSGNIDHLIAHECGHIYRMMSVPSEYRKVPASNTENKRIALIKIENELFKLSKDIPIEKLSSLFEIWFNGIIKQLTNFPVDMRIEQWIFENYPELRKSQKITIEKQIRENVQALSENIKKISPSFIYDASNTMNYAFASFMESLLDKKYITPYKRTKYPEVGTKLVRLLKDTKDEGYKQDIEIINNWSKILDLPDWFYWTDFEDVPPGYLD
jgi:hypothetical protein